jgi:N-acetylglucosamine-6-sulfatase
MSDKGTNGQFLRLGPLGKLPVRAAALIVLLNLVVLPTAGAAQEISPSEKPNIVYILTDDLDTYTLNQMETTRSSLADKGVTFENATFSTPLCCPSRATMQRGQYPHNTGVVANNPPNGGFEAFHALGRYTSTYATWLDEAGYQTGYFGKYMNGYEAEEFRSFVPPGWDRWFAAASAPMKKQFNNTGTIVSIRNRTFDQTVAGRGLDFIEDRAPSRTPFMVAFNFYAPHYPAEHPASLDELYKEAELPPDPSFSEVDVSDKPQWMQVLDSVDATEREALTEYHRDRLRSVEYVDQAVGKIVKTLARSGELKNTYIVFWGDNGYHLGQHRLQNQTTGGKLSPYSPDVELPMYVRGPGISAGTVSKKMASNVDVAPTFADMGGARVPRFVDGRSLLPVAQGKRVEWRKFAYSAAWPQSEGTGLSGMEDWRQIRTAQTAYHYYPRTGEEELYDLEGDPYQLENLLYRGVSDEEEILRASYRDLSERMNDCAGAECRNIEGM